MRRFAAAVAALALATGGYAVADAHDVVPGILTLDQARAAAPRPAPATSGPRPVTAAPVLAPAGTDAPVPTTAGLQAALADAVEDPRLGPRVGAEVRDALTGSVLWSHDAATPQTPASTAKLLTAAAITSTTDMAQVMTTRAVTGSDPGEVVLVASGDTMLAKGAGDPSAVEGRAGLADLAAQVVAARRAEGATGPLRLRLDATYAAGPRYLPTWAPDDVADGYTQAVTMVGLAGERPEPYQPSPRFPERSVLAAFAEALTAKGAGRVVVEDSATSWTVAAPEGATTLGAVESAPLGEVLALALDHSDNALTENLARQAAVEAGAGADAASVVRWVRTTLADEGVDLTGVTLRDSCGLSSGQKIPARVLSDVMQLGITGPAKGLRGVLLDLPVGGVSGTLAERYREDASRPAAGVVRAKTGTLTGTSSLAGTTVDADGRLLTFAVVADEVPSTTGTLGARAALDDAVAILTGCGCR